MGGGTYVPGALHEYGMLRAQPAAPRLPAGLRLLPAAAATTKRLYPPPAIVRQPDIALSSSMPGICGAKYCSGSAISQITFLACLYTIDSGKSQAFWQIYLFYCELCAAICQMISVVGCFWVVVQLSSERDIARIFHQISVAPANLTPSQALCLPTDFDVS